MADRAKVGSRFWIEVVLATITGILTVVTLLSREWIEIVFHVDPDGGSGALEWAIAVVLAFVTLGFSLLARAEWRHAATTPSQ